MTETQPISLLERYQRLLEISRDLASTLDLEALLNHIVQAASDLSTAEAASILLYDSIKQELYFDAATNLDTPLMRGLVVPVEGSIAGWIVQNRQPIIISETRKDPRHFTGIAKATNVTTNSILGVPLIAKDKIVGVLEAINKLSGEFTDEDQELLLALGAQAAVAIQNARLFQQSDLISDLVHELRTPLTSLNTAARLLLRQGITEESRLKMGEVILSEANRLNEMTTAFLDLARLESGRMQFQLKVFNLEPVVEESIELMRGKAEERGIQVKISLQADLPALRGDRDKIKQVLLNLLSNAIKYNKPNGEITVSVQASTAEFLLLVQDTGNGIPEESLGRIFEKFYRVPGSEHSAQGTGLGLSICKKIIEAHGGQIQVSSEVEKGTTVQVTLPYKISG